MNETSETCAIEELMAVVIARDLKDGEKGLTGLATTPRTRLLAVGIPLAAMGLAQQMHAPNLTILYGGIVVNPRLDDIAALDRSDMDRRRVRATARLSLDYAFGLARRGEIDIGFSTAAQVDRYGNVNTTCLGPHAQPHVRLVGSVCLPEQFSSFGREYIIMEHCRRNFVERVDFITGAGYLGGAHAREQIGLPLSGPRLVVTNLGVMGFNAATKRMQLESLHPGVSLDHLREQTGFSLLVPHPVPRTQPPTLEELARLRHQVDPRGLLLPRQRRQA